MSRFDRIHIRDFEADDTSQTADVFYEAVHVGAKDVYDEKQRKAWAPKRPDLSSWEERKTAQTSKVALLDTDVVGFMTLTSEGKIDLAFVIPDAMGKGVAGKLYASLLRDAKSAGHRQLTTEASHLARSFFEKRGWHVVKQQTVIRSDVALTNFLMQLDVSSQN